MQVGEVGQLRWYLAAQAEAVEVQPCNAPVVVGGDAVPFAEGSVSQPFAYIFCVTTTPGLTVRCIVEGNQGFPVRFYGSRSRGRRCCSDRRRRVSGGGRLCIRSAE